MAKRLPSGTVTFLFTDIEGSTRLLRELGDAYDDVIDQHHRLLREVWDRNRGVEVNTEGDSFFVAFADPVDALTAAVDAQRTLTGAEWPEGRAVPVRMGLHSGYGRPVDDDYRALAVHQAARVVNAANGDQIFATDEVLALVRDVPNLGIDVVPLGRFRIQDFDDAVALHSISAPDLERDLRRPRVRPADTHNLVRPTTSLVDRVVEQAELVELVQPGMLVSLIGPGGAGKTRLSIEVGFATVERWPDGVWFVDLAPVADGEVVATATADAVNAPSIPGNTARADVIAHLADRSQLLVLDNCEHLVEPVAMLVHELLQSCPKVGVLATSRVPLGLLGEQAYRLDPLPTNGVDSPAVRLFVERTGVDGSSDLPSIAGLCQDLDGLPLAIEIAATRAHLLTPTEMQTRLRGGVGVVTTRDPTLPDRQRSLGRLLDWTIDFLSPNEQTALTRLAVFADDFDGDLADAVVADETIAVDEVPELVWSLADWSLLRREIAAGSTRYSLLSTVRAHVRQRAREGDVMEAHQRLAQALLERVGPQRTLSRDVVAELEVELDNIRAVVAHSDVPDDVARPLAWSIGQYHDVKALYRTGISELGRCIEQRPAPGPDLVALLTLQADLHLRLGETAEAEQIAARAIALADHVGTAEWDDMGVVRTQGELALRSDDPEAAIRLAEDALENDPATARSEARLWNLVAIAQYTYGDIEAACRALDHGLRAEERAGLETFLANTHGNLAEALLQLDEPARAAEHQLAALEYARSMGQPISIAFSSMVAARFALDDGAASDAVRIQAGADRLLDREGYSLYERDQARRTALLDTARLAIGNRDYQRLLANAGGVALEHLADEAAAILQRRARSNVPSKETPE